MLVPALNRVTGYDKAAKIAHQAHAEGRTLREAALEQGVITAEQFNAVMDPAKMTSQEK